MGSDSNKFQLVVPSSADEQPWLEFSGIMVGTGFQHQVHANIEDSFLFFWHIHVAENLRNPALNAFPAPYVAGMSKTM